MQLRPYVATNAEMFTILPFTELSFVKKFAGPCSYIIDSIVWASIA